MKLSTIPAVLLTSLALAVPAAALEGCQPSEVFLDTGRDAYDATGGDDCDAGPSPDACRATAPAKGELTGGNGEHGVRVYVENELCQPIIGDGTCTFSIWVWMESNGEDGLQGGSRGIPECGNGPSDTSIF